MPSRREAQERTKNWFARHPRLSMAAAGATMGAAVLLATQVGPGARGCARPSNVAWPTCDPLPQAFIDTAERDGYDSNAWVSVVEWRHTSGEQGWHQPPGTCGYLLPAVADTIKGNPGAMQTRCAVYQYDASGTLGNYSSKEEWSFGAVGALITASEATNDIDLMTHDDCTQKCGFCGPPPA